MDNNIISVISLIIALLAVFFGPLISLWIAKEQLKGLNKQIISPIRQIWINDVREILAEISSKLLHYRVAGYRDRRDKEYYQMIFLENKLGLFLNTKEEDHAELMKIVRETNSILSSSYSEVSAKRFQELHSKITEIGQKILKREWERVKNDT